MLGLMKHYIQQIMYHQGLNCSIQPVCSQKLHIWMYVCIDKLDEYPHMRAGRFNASVCFLSLHV